MGKPYAAELESLPNTYTWCLRAPISTLADHVQSYAKSPILTIGSGGSFTSASFCEYVHQVCTGQIAKALTPLEAVYSPLDFRHTSLLLLTASGKNPDVIGAFTRLAEREPRFLGALCTRGKSLLAKLAASFNKARVFEFDIPTGKDGYLATNSLLATIILLTRAYESAKLLEATLPGTFLELLPGYSGLDVFRKNLAARAAPLWARRTLAVLHTPATRSAAIDLESRFSEAALGNVQLADYRNFAHGRHYWLAAQQQTTAIIAFVTKEIANLADQTLRLVPDRIPILRVDLPEEGILTSIISIVYSLYFAELAGEAASVDPGKPTVPEFGRRLYNLRAFHEPLKQEASISAAEVLAIERKSRKTIRRLRMCDELSKWQSAYHLFVSALLEARFTALVFDYDGTLCEAWERHEGPRREVIEPLEHLARNGIVIGVATGRGKSVKQQLRERFDPSLWDKIPIAYHNGSELGLLSNDDIPKPDAEPISVLNTIKDLLTEQPLLLEHCSIELTRNQLTVAPYSSFWAISELWEFLCTIIELHSFRDVRVLRSDHSVDILGPGASKLAILNIIQSLVGNRNANPILCIGDRGAWPGNDCDLLCQPFALSVDETSLDPKTCWNFASTGISHTRALLQYLSLIEYQSGRAFFSAQRFREIYK